MNKKGALNWNYIGMLVIILIGFAISLIFYFQLNPSPLIDREACHASVIQRGTLPEFGGAKNYVPLKCQTEKMCFGEECEEEFKGKKGVQYVEVDDVEDINREISREILECWTTMGEGKVSIYSEWVADTYSFKKVYPSCVICTRIAFNEEELTKKGIDLNEVNVQDYLLNYAAPNSDKSYFELMTGQKGASVSAENLGDIGKLTFEGEVEVDGKKEKVSFDFDPSKLSQDELKNIQNLAPTNDYELGIIFMQISAPTHWGAFQNLAVTAGAGGAALFLTPGVGGVSRGVARLACGNAIGAVICGGIAAITVGYQQYSVYENQEITAGVCGDVSSGWDARQGCSVVRAIPYDVNSLKEYCGVIESIE